jgi:hypothetical protein
MKKKIKQLIFLIILLAGARISFAQPRAEIDQARTNLNYFDKEALQKAKEFIRKDSSYYVGYMYEGSYKYYRAADIPGFNNAIKPLQKALDLLIRDYARKLKVRSTDIMSFVDAYKYQYDYCVIVGLLEESYRNIEKPDMALNILLDMRKRNLQKEFYGDAFTTISWIYHRSRMYTKEKYAFLGNSIEENDRIALAYCDSAVLKYKKNRYINSQIFPKDFVDDDLYRVYHYKSLIYAYMMQNDSAEKYYRLLMPTIIFPNSNYATFKLTQGDFGSAEEYYLKAQQTDYSDKRIREANYMLSMINIYQSKPKEAISMLQEMIRAQGSTPGFGWHNIALARTYFYEGLLDESMLTADKAAQFHELHIGTTWGQGQYDLGVNLISYMNQDRQISSVKFEDQNWWWDYKALSDLPGYYLKKYSTLFVLANQFASNPERENVTYKLFSSESITTFDEIWYLIRDFSPDFFIKTFERYLKEDKRPRIKKYFRYFIARYLMDKGETKKAISLFYQVLADNTLDRDNEKLLIARVYEGLALASDKDDNDLARDIYIQKFYEQYPQLVPFCGYQMNFNLKAPENLSETEKSIIDELKSCDIDFTGDKNAPTVSIGFRVNAKNLKELHYEVTSSTGEAIVPASSFIINQPKGSGKKLAYRIFNITKP